MTSYCRSLPRTLEWAAQVDGATWWQTFRRVLLPVATPGLVAAGIFCFIAAWNEFLIARVLSSTLASRTVPVTLSAAGGPPTAFAGGALAVLPPILIAFLLQRYLV